MPEAKLPCVLVYRNELLERSETFIAAQAGALRRYEPTYCGLHKRTGGILPASAPSVVLGCQSGMVAAARRTLYLHTGYAPDWIARIAARTASLIHAHFALDAACALPVAAKLGLPLIVTLHGYDVTSSLEALRGSRGGRLYLRRQAALFHRTHTFICVSEFIRERALKAGFPAHKLWVHSIGIDLNTYQPEQTVTGQHQGMPTVLFVGRLVEKKGCVYLLRAMQIIQRSHTSRLVIIGDGPLRVQLEQTARDLGLQYCDFLGAQNAAVVRGWLQQAAVFSVPSITATNGDSEGLGMVFCEAQAMGVPVVSFASGGVPEAIANGKSGFLVPERDHTGLAASICLLLENKPLHSQMCTNGRAHVAAKFDIRKQTDLLEARYDLALAGCSLKNPRSLKPLPDAESPDPLPIHQRALAPRQGSPT